MKISIRHVTRYTYPEQVQFTPHRILLRPRENPSLRVLSMDLNVQPAASIKWMVDSFENQIAVAYFEEQSDVIEVEANILTELLTDNPFDFIIEPYAENYPFSYNPSERKALSPYLEVGSPSGCARVLPWIWSEFPQLPGQSLDLLTQLNRRIHERFQYRRRDEEGVQTPDETISLGSGSCRDFARLFTECCRQLGFAARFVSGYLYDPPSGDEHFQNVAEGAMHACAEVFLPGAGWKGFDSTNGMLANQFFIPCAVANEPKLTSPIQGSYYHAQMRVPSTMDVSLDVERVDLDHVSI
jgi:transglutaminase-like putative cysteine protease